MNQALAAWSFRQIPSAEFVSPIYNLETIGSELSQIQPIAPNLSATLSIYGVGSVEMILEFQVAYIDLN